MSPADLQTTQTKVKKSDANKTKSQANVLLVDDSEEIRMFIGFILKRAGIFNVIEAGSGEEAISQCKVQKIDCALIDIQMPGMNGWQTLDALRQSGYSFPCIALSADDEEKSRALKGKQEFESYQTKPVDHEALINSIEALLE